ncbi:MAG: maleylacetate reductase [Rhizobiaceae bacterium]|nr:maleylacetate reductase [Rhizobiaceae bacterium]
MSVFHAGFDPSGDVVRVRFEPGARHCIKDELEVLGCSRALVLTTPQQEAQGTEIADALGNKACGLFANATMHTPVEVTAEAMKVATDTGADVVVAIGGGSTIGLAKAIAYRTDLPQIVVPTTYAGSEATSVLGQMENGTKQTLKSPRVQPEVVIYDPELVMTLPANMTVTSGLNAMAHAIEALYSQDANPLSNELALAGIRSFVNGLPDVVKDLRDIQARTDTLFGSWLCGSVMAQVGMALHHKLCHTIGGSLNLPHSKVHAIILPHATAYNEVAAAESLAPIAKLLNSNSAAGGLYDFAKSLDAPRALKDFGVSKIDLDKVADLAVMNPYWNPCSIEREAVRALLGRAWEGARPE